jgi:hypothetical protein
MIENTYISNDEIKNISENKQEDQSRRVKIEVLRYFNIFKLNKNLPLEKFLSLYFKIKDKLIKAENLRDPKNLFPLILWASSEFLNFDINETGKRRILKMSNLPSYKLHLYKLKISLLINQYFN